MQAGAEDNPELTQTAGVPEGMTLNHTHVGVNDERDLSNNVQEENLASPELEVALERARLLAEQRQQAWITPLHMLYVLLDSDGPLTPTLERAALRQRPY